MPEERPVQSTPAEDPPEIQDNRPRSLILLGCGIIIALLLLLVVINLDRGETGPRGAQGTERAPLVVVPEPLSEEERSGGAAESAERPIRIAAGGWIQVADEAGDLAQQYRCLRLDPDPEGMGPGWLEMVDPELEIYLSDGRIAHLTSERALAYAPNRIIESGTVTGNVRLRLLHPIETEDRKDAHAPRLLLRTEEAVFDNILGEIECDGAVTVETSDVEFSGSRLRISINDESEVIQRLEIETVEHIRLTGIAAEDEEQVAAVQRRDDERTTDSKPNGSRLRPTASGDRAVAKAQGKDESESRRRPAGADATKDRTRETRTDEDPVFYLLTLREDVRIQRGEGPDARTAIGDLLSLVFTMESGEMDTMLARRSAGAFPAAVEPFRGEKLESAAEDQMQMAPVASRGRAIPALLLDFAIAAQHEEAEHLAPPPSAGDTIIYCEGPLTMVPLPQGMRTPSTPQDSLLQLTGNPVLLHDGSARAHVSCAALEYETGKSQLELMRSADHELILISPDLHARAERFWLRREEQRAGFTGPGTMDFLRSSYSVDQVDGELAQAREKDFAEHLHLDWTRAVDLEFAPGEQENDLGALRKAVLSGDVQAEGHRLTLTGGGGAAPQPDSGSAAAELDAAAAQAEDMDSADKPGRLRSEEVILGFTEDETGEQILERLIATGDVEVSDERQSLWARTLDVTFGDDAQRQAESAPESAIEGTGGDETQAQRELGRLQTAIARGDVQLMMSGGMRAFGDRLDISDGGQHAELTGRTVSIVDGAGFIDEATRITIDPENQIYRLHGSGLFSQFDKPLLPEVDSRIEPSRLDDLRAAAGLQEQLRITWRDGVDIRPQPLDAPTAAEAEAPFHRVHFLGDVYVHGPELRLDHADELKVTMASSEDRSNVSFLEAIGNVIARSAGEPGEIRSELLQVEMETTEEGVSRPRELTATGGVHVADATQHLWSDDLSVTFREVSADASGSSSNSAAEELEGSGVRFTDTRVEIDQLRARGAVQLLLEDGRRVFADELLGDGGEERAELRGDRILVVSSDFVIDAEERLTLEKRAGRVEVAGPGEAYAYGKPLVLASVSQPVEPPMLSGEKTMEARWSRSASYVTAADVESNEAPRGSAAGVDAREEDPTRVLELHGDVFVRSTPTALEMDTAEAEHLTLEFIERTDAENPSQPTHELRRLIARGNGQLESRKWSHPEQADVPRVFYIAGDHVDFDQVQQTATVIGAGELLIRDEQSDESEAGVGGSSSVGFNARGTTTFKWQQRLRLEPDVDDLFHLVMEGDVSCLHRDVAGQTAQLWAQQLEATVQRLPDDAEAGDAGEAGDTEVVDRSAGATLDLGGPMELRRLEASGGVSVRTPDRDVACDEFEYNPVTGIARAAAAPGRTVSILSAGSGRPMRAESILWNMRKDTITILRGRGSGAP